ncbi:MAG: DUF2262 domain-containing protein, partial [Solobacterium sp.]|nr:DUF2262 domain-containing protein [Solobacterium sp.]
ILFVNVQVKEGTADAQMQLERLKQICANLEPFIAKIRQYIAEDETLWDWVDESEGSHDGFEQKLAGPSLVIDENNETEVWFDGGEPFGYHSIIVYVNQQDACTGINLVG